MEMCRGTEVEIYVLLTSILDGGVTGQLQAAAGCQLDGWLNGTQSRSWRGGYPSRKSSFSCPAIWSLN
jgi:hypothetical protein